MDRPDATPNQVLGRRPSCWSGRARVAVWTLLALAAPAAAQEAGSCVALAHPRSLSFLELQRSDLARAEAACRRARLANPADSEAEALIGRVLHARGFFTSARAQYERAAEAGNPLAQYNLAWMLTAGEGVAKDEAAATRLIQDAAAAGYPPAKTDLGVRHLQGTGVALDEDEGWRLIEEGAEAGDGYAMTIMGDRALNASDAAEAMRWWRAAAEAEDPAGMAQLGTAYMVGDHVPRDDDEALRWLQAAAERGDGLAMFNLGLLLADRDREFRHADEAAIWLLGSAAVGHAGFLDQASRFDAVVLRSVEEMLAANGFSDGDADGRLGEAGMEALRDFAAETDVLAFLAMADARRGEIKAEADAAALALLEAMLEASQAEREATEQLGPRSNEPEALVIDHTPQEPMSAAWRGFITDVVTPNRNAKLGELESSSEAAVGGVWIGILAVDASTGLVYYTKPQDGRLFSIGAQQVSETGLPPVGDRSGAEPERLLAVDLDIDHPEWDRWIRNLRFYFGDDELNGFGFRDEAALTGFFGDPSILVLAADQERQMIYFVRDDDGYLYRAGADHVISEQEAGLRDLGRGAAAIGLTICLMTDACEQ